MMKQPVTLGSEAVNSDILMGGAQAWPEFQQEGKQQTFKFSNPKTPSS